MAFQQWHRERPDLDVSPMGVIGRLGRCAALLRRELDKLFSSFGLTAWEFDVLATLCRSGEPTAWHRPHCSDPDGHLRHHDPAVAAAGSRRLVSRQANPSDARSLLVQLTPAGLVNWIGSRGNRACRQ